MYPFLPLCPPLAVAAVVVDKGADVNPFASLTTT